MPFHITHVVCDDSLSLALLIKEASESDISDIVAVTANGTFVKPAKQSTPAVGTICLRSSEYSPEVPIGVCDRLKFASQMGLPFFPLDELRVIDNDVFVWRVLL